MHVISDIADALFYARMARENKAISKAYIESLELTLVSILRRDGYDPGHSSSDADKLKLVLVQEERTSCAEEHEDENTVHDWLDHMGEQSGSDDWLRELSRLLAFLMEARYGNCCINNCDIPVQAWLEKHPEHSACDLSSGMKAYEAWNAEMSAKFKSGPKWILGDDKAP